MPRHPGAGSQIRLPGRSELLQNTLQHMLSRDPAKRPSAEALQHLALEQAGSAAVDDEEDDAEHLCTTPGSQMLRRQLPRSPEEAIALQQRCVEPAVPGRSLIISLLHSGEFSLSHAPPPPSSARVSTLLASLWHGRDFFGNSIRHPVSL